jgi:hypothetical protein
MGGDCADKPALLAGRLTFTVAAQDLACRASDGAEKWRLDWGQVSAAAVVEHKVRRNMLRWLVLLIPATGAALVVAHKSWRRRPTIAAETLTRGLRIVADAGKDAPDLQS